MNIEHIGMLVDNPVSMGNWYRDNLGFRILRQSGTDSDGVTFLESGNGTVLEFGKLPDRPTLQFRRLDPVSLHVAIDCADPAGEATRLITAGAEMVGDSPRSATGEIVLVRDPWGMVIQLICRKSKLRNQE